MESHEVPTPEELAEVPALHPLGFIGFDARMTPHELAGFPLKEEGE